MNRRNPAKAECVVTKFNDGVLVSTEVIKPKMPRPRGGFKAEINIESGRAMTNDDAHRVMYGDLKGVPHKVAAQQLGLTYGQVYSARGGYTFKHVKE